MKNTIRNKQAVRQFKRDIGLLLCQCRLEQKLQLSQVAKILNCDLRFLEHIEVGKVSLSQFWQVVKMFRLYGKKIRLVVEQDFEVKNYIKS